MLNKNPITRPPAVMKLNRTTNLQSSQFVPSCRTGPNLLHAAGFTLFELLGVVVLCVIFVGLFMSDGRSARPRAERIHCVNNLKNIGLAVRSSEADGKPVAWLSTNSAARDTKTLDSEDLDQTLTSLSAYLTGIKVFRCPSDNRQLTSSTQSLTNLPPGILSAECSYFFNVARSGVGDESSMILAGDRNLEIDGPPKHDYRTANPRTEAWQIGTNLLSSTNMGGIRFADSIHRSCGNLLLSDGSVQRLSNGRMREEFSNSLRTKGQGLLLLMPVADADEQKAARR